LTVQELERFFHPHTGYFHAPADAHATRY
jgi:hypothetical protein